MKKRTKEICENIVEGLCEVGLNMSLCIQAQGSPKTIYNLTPSTEEGWELRSPTLKREVLLEGGLLAQGSRHVSPNVCIFGGWSHFAETKVACRKPYPLWIRNVPKTQARYTASWESVVPRGNKRSTDLIGLSIS